MDHISVHFLVQYAYFVKIKITNQNITNIVLIPSKEILQKNMPIAIIAITQVRRQPRTRENDKNYFWERHCIFFCYVIVIVFMITG